MLQTCLLVLLLAAPVAPALAVSASSFSEALPQERVLDQAGVLSRAASTDVSRQLEALTAERVDAHLITLKQLDYGLSLNQLGDALLQRWQPSGDANGLLLFLIDAQTNSSAVVASPSLSGQLSADLLRSTARFTMTTPIRDGARFRQASLDGIQRIGTVLRGGEDPGVPQVAEEISPTSNVPSREQTESSNAFTWVVVLLVVGTVVPMATWWVFSR
ncbi:MAG: TPM domain-containing protein [Cyanobium sp. M30B3]|nr:MAG: TPM domain-containing protein [Cyanobium sp. M30B3]